MPTEHHLVTMRYEQHLIQGWEIDGEIWLGVGQIVLPLGMSKAEHVTRLFNRRKDEFGAAETTMIDVQTAGGVQKVRVFSLRGARLLAILADTEPSKRFRRWILDVLDGKAPMRRVPGVGPVVIVDPADSPLLQSAIGKMLKASEVLSLAKREAERLGTEGRRLASMVNVPGDVLALLVKREKKRLAKALRQPSLPLLEG